MYFQNLKKKMEAWIVIVVYALVKLLSDVASKDNNKPTK